MDDVARETISAAEDRHVRDLARTDMRRALVLCVAVGAFMAGVMTARATTATCDPSQDGCRFDADGTTYQTVQGVSWPVCAHEGDDGPCVWDASRDGNGHGRSFVVADGTVTYLP